MVQGDAYRLRRLLGELIAQPAAAVVSGLPLVTKPLRMRLRLMSEAMTLLRRARPLCSSPTRCCRRFRENSRACGPKLPSYLDEPAARARVGLSRPLMHQVVRCPVARW